MSLNHLSAEQNEKKQTKEMKKWELVQRILAILNELEEEDEYQLKKDKEMLLRVAREMIW